MNQEFAGLEDKNRLTGSQENREKKDGKKSFVELLKERPISIVPVKFDFDIKNINNFAPGKEIVICDVDVEDLAEDSNLIEGGYSKDNITDRVNCVVKLEDGTNAAPTGQGITDKDYLNNNGWTVTTN